MKFPSTFISFICLFVFTGSLNCSAQTFDVTFESLLKEMGDRMMMTQWPAHEYRSMQASSYNRASVAPDKPGWFADSDGVSWIREEYHNGKKEYVIMEHDGPGCITRMWTPFFYYDFNNRVGPRVKIYLDGNNEPVIDGNFIALLSGKGSVKPPFATYTARAGVCFLPIPFAKSCKITVDDKAFYNIINYRAYEKGTKVKTFYTDEYANAASLLAATARELKDPQHKAEEKKTLAWIIQPGDSVSYDLPKGNHAVEQLVIQIGGKNIDDNQKRYLRSTIIKLTFDGKQTVWCPLGDFFCSPDSIHPFQTRNLSVSKEGKMTCNWVMPYSSSARLSLINFQDTKLKVSVNLEIGSRAWDKESMYFHTNWTTTGPLPGNHFFDLNFIDIEGKGRIAGDALAVLSPSTGWWGEGDEKIYIDQNDQARRFPSHFGTGTEDYYGWAGGVVPTGNDVFSMPFGSNVHIGNPANPRGYNICMRNRILDDIPFNNRLVFDMEASPGTDIRNEWNLLGYSMVTYWYGMPGAKLNRNPRPDLAKRSILSLAQLDLLQQMIRDSIISFHPRILKKLVGDSQPSEGPNP